MKYLKFLQNFSSLSFSSAKVSWSKILKTIIPKITLEIIVDVMICRGIWINWIQILFWLLEEENTCPQIVYLREKRVQWLFKGNAVFNVCIFEFHRLTILISISYFTKPWNCIILVKKQRIICKEIFFSKEMLSINLQTWDQTCTICTND